MDSMMDVVVERPILMPEMDDDAGGVSDSGSTVVNSDTNTEGNTSHTNTEGEKTSEHASGKESTGGEKSDRKSRKKKDRRKKDKKERTERERGDKKNKTESVKALEEENAQLKNDLNDLQLRLVYLEARDHNKELKLIHLQKELEETRSILIEKEGDCVEWEQIDREKDKTVISLNQTIAILQRDLTVLLEEKESSHTPKKHHVKKTNRLVFSPKPEEVFEYPREEDYDSDEELTSDYEDEEEEEEDNGAPVEPSEDETNEEEETNEVIEKEVDESEITTNPAVFFPFPSLSTLPAEPVYVAAPQEPIIENPLVKIFSPTVPPSHLNFGADSPTLSHNSASPSPSPSPSPTPSPQQNTNKPHPPSSAPPSHKTNGAPPPTHPNGNSPRQSISPSNSASNLSVKTDSNHHHQQQQQSQTSPTHPTSPSQTHFPDVDLPMNVSVRELRSMWENPKSSVSSSPNNSSTRLK